MFACFRCEGEVIKDTPTNDTGLDFHHCATCGCQYVLSENNRLYDRWGTPLSHVLYAVIFEKEPVLIAKEVAREFVQRDESYVGILIKDINQELENPKQQVMDILNFEYPDETKLREYLTMFLSELKKIN